MQIILKDGSPLELPADATAMDAAKALSGGLARAALLARVNGEVKELSAPLRDGDTLEILTGGDEDSLRALRHSASHVLAQAVKRLYPAAKLAIGPAIDNGFYYDIDLPPNPEGFASFDAQALQKIEAEMKNIIKEALPITRFTLPRQEALDFVQARGEDYKAELIRDLPEDAVISFYRQGDFTDLCAGPHIPDTGRVKAFALLSSTGAYWRGDSKRPMLQRIYGTAFADKKDLAAHLAMLEEAKKRDHNKLGRELELFTTVDYIGQGLPILMPKGARIIQILQRFVEDEEQRRGYLLTKTPFMAKSDLYRISGHWDHYRDGMCIMGEEENGEELLALRHMTCTFQFQVYLSRMRSYRDLPMRFNETSTLFRNEDSGEMHGLIRVRQFTLSEGHIACTPAQLEGEFRGCVDLAFYMLKTLGLDEDVSYRFSKWDENDRDKYIGTPEQWEEAQGRMREILDDLKIPYKEADGEAAFYGPKLDIQIRNVFGKEDTLITIQVDFMLAERFGMEYVDTDGTKKHPYVVHRSSIGCYERTLALLIEKYAGAFPAWLAPVQVKVLPITDRSHEYAAAVFQKLQDAGFRCELDDRSEKIGYKIREAQLEKVPYMLVLGDKEQEAGNLAVRARRDGATTVMSYDDFAALLKQEVDSKAR